MEPARQRVEAAARDRLRAPLDPLAAFEHLPDLRMRLQLLQQVVRRERGVAVVEPDDHADRDHVVAHRVDERAAELAVLAPVRSGQPIVWTMRSSGFATFQTSFTPSSHTCGSSPRRPKWSSATPVRWPCVPSASTVTFATMSEPASKLPSSPPSRPRPLSPVRDADHAAVGDEQLLRRGLGQDHRAALLGAARRASGRAARARRSSCRGCASSAAAGCGSAAAAREDVDGLAVHRAVRRHVLDAVAVLEETAQRARVDDRAGEQVRAGLLALLDDRDRHVAEPLGDVGMLLEQLAEADRAGEARRAGADDEHADLDALVDRVGRLGDELARRRTAAGSRTRGVTRLAGVDELGELRDDLVHVADDAEVAELEDRRVRVLVDRDDHVRALHADLVLDRAGDAERDVELRRDDLAGLADLRRVRVPAGVDDGARRADRAAERARELLGEREVLGRAEAAAAGDDHVGVLDRRAARLAPAPGSTTFAPLSSAPRSSTATSSTCGSPPRLRRASNEPARKSASRGVERPADVDETESCSAGRLPTSSPSRDSTSTRSQLRPASRRAARPAAMSAASTEFANSTVS